MKVRLLTVSQRQPDWVIAGEHDYARRLPREWSYEVVEIKPATRSKGVGADRVRATEADRLRAQLARPAYKGARLVVLDERGEAWSTATLSQRLARWQQEGRDLVLVIGGADGLAPDLLAGAQQRWSLSAATLPHGLVRIVVTEQLYRAASLLAGHPYHRA